MFREGSETFVGSYINSFLHVYYMIYRVQGCRKRDNLPAEESSDLPREGSNDSASEMQHHKSTKLKSGRAWPSFEASLPTTTNSSANVSPHSSSVYFLSDHFVFSRIHLMVVTVSFVDNLFSAGFHLEGRGSVCCMQ